MIADKQKRRFCEGVMGGCPKGHRLYRKRHLFPITDRVHRIFTERADLKTFYQCMPCFHKTNIYLAEEEIKIYKEYLDGTRRRRFATVPREDDEKKLAEYEDMLKYNKQELAKIEGDG